MALTETIKRLIDNAWDDGYPCLLAGRRLAPGLRGAALGAIGLAGWDLFLDPQMVAAGHWRWTQPSPGSTRLPHLR